MKWLLRGESTFFPDDIIKKLSNVTVDEFMMGELSSDDSELLESSRIFKNIAVKRTSENNKSIGIKKTQKSPSNENNMMSSDDDQGVADHKASLQKLKEKDPEFYDFLRTNDDELLNFDTSEDESENDDPEKLDKYHKLPDKLESGSDDSEVSEVEEEEQQEGLVSITPAVVASWRRQLQDKPSSNILHDVIEAFRAAVQGADGGTPSAKFRFKVESGAGFNAVIRLCLEDLLPALFKILKLSLPTTSQLHKNVLNPTKSRHWKKFLAPIKSYLVDTVKLLNIVAESSVAAVILKHMLQLVPFCLPFPKIAKTLLKKLILLWSTSDETVRVLSFLVILRLASGLPKDYTDYILRHMYMAYVRNCKFTSPSSWPLINFMKKSLVEIYALNQSLAYEHAFVYIRQLAIHLRNAITIKKKNSHQAVYNWQYIHCLLLWNHLLSTLYPTESLQPIIYPLVQITIGTIKLIPTPKFFPLRFHLIRSLMKLSSDTDTFIPVLPFILEVFDLVDFSKKHTSLSMKPIDFYCTLKLSKSQLQENGFKDGVVDQLYELLMEYLQTQDHCIGFPELVLPAVVQLKDFLKKCKIGNYCRQMKQILNKMEENSNFIIELRKNVNFSITELESLKQWEQKVKEQGTPLSKYYTTWRKLRDNELLHGITKKEQLDDYYLPTVKRKEIEEKKKRDNKTFTELLEGIYDGDSEDDSVRFLPKEERPAMSGFKVGNGKITDENNGLGDQKNMKLSESSNQHKISNDERKPVIKPSIKDQKFDEDTVEELLLSSSSDGENGHNSPSDESTDGDDE
ncbi:nucleolar complex protein 2 isoform X2 [Tachypleus tridentatus]|uniref:nucleolar complex protein 2 isoform X2 n=1 Tax=Tachypleus tridentatus TaxID=6853 RepID=UPI003FD42641